MRAAVSNEAVPKQTGQLLDCEATFRLCTIIAAPRGELKVRVPERHAVPLMARPSQLSKMPSYWR